MNSIKSHVAVDEVENAFLDDGRFFVHLKTDWDWGTDPCQRIGTKSFGSIVEARKALKVIKRVLTGANCDK